MNNYYCRSYETTEVWDHCRNSLWGPQSAKAAFVKIYLYVWMWLSTLITILVWFSPRLVQISLWNCWKGLLVKKIHVVQVPLSEWIWILSLNKLQIFPFKNHVGNLKLNGFFLKTQQIGHKRLFQTFLKWQKEWTLNLNYWYQFCHLSYIQYWNNFVNLKFTRKHA